MTAPYNPAAHPSPGFPTTVLDNLPGLVYRCRHDAACTMAFISRGAQELTGYSVDEFTAGGRSWRDLVHPEDRELQRSAIQRAVDNGERFLVTYRIVHADGSHRWVEENGCSMPAPDERAPMREGFIRDVSDQMRAQQEAKLLQVLACAIGEAGDVREALDAVLHQVCRATGWTVGEAWIPDGDGRVLRCLHSWSEPEPELIDFREASRARSFAPGEGLPGITWQRRRPHWIEDVSVAPDFPRRDPAVNARLKAALGVPVFSNGEVVLVLDFFLRQWRQHDPAFVSLISAVATQIGLLIERKRTADALARERALAETTLRTLPGIFYLFDADLRLRRWNDNFERATGYTADELPGLPPQHFIAPEDWLRMDERIGTAFTQGSADLEASVLTREGERTAYYLTGAAVALEGRTHLVGMGFDITALAQTRAELARNLGEFQALHHVGRALGSQISVETVVSAAIEAVTRATAAEFVVLYQTEGERLTQFRTGENGALACPRAGVALEMGECLCGLVARDRTAVFCSDLSCDSRCTRSECKLAGMKSFAALPLLSEGELLGVLGIGAREVRHFSEQALFLEAIATQVTLSLRNARLYDKVGRHASELERQIAARLEDQATLRLQASALNAAANAIMITDHGGRIEWVNPAWCLMTGYRPEEVVGRTPRVLRSGHHDAAHYARLWQRILSGATVQENLVNRRKDGSLVHVHETITPLADANGTITHFIAIKQDVGERLALEEQLRQSQKMDAIGKLAGGIAHDFNNLLTIIQGNCSVVRLDGVPDQERNEALEEIVRASDRAASLTRQLLAFGRRQVLQPHPLELNEAINQTARMLRRLIGEDIRLELRLCAAQLHTRADPNMLDQLLMNLAINARDAMPHGGQLVVATRSFPATAAELRRHADLLPGPHARIQVSDSGCGISPENLPHIFDPFFTTKGPGHGTGLGLATVFGIVKQHGGAIAVASEPGRGSTFEVFLPLDVPTEPVAATAKSAGTPPGTGQTILVVEDEPALQRLTSRVLQKHGYRVHLACDGREALRLVADEHLQFDLLLTDVIMPGGITGPELASRIRSTHADVKVVFMSGYTGERAGNDVDLQEGFNFLQKPFTADALLDCLKARLRGPDPA